MPSCAHMHTQLVTTSVLHFVELVTFRLLPFGEEGAKHFQNLSKVAQVFSRVVSSSYTPKTINVFRFIGA